MLTYSHHLTNSPLCLQILARRLAWISAPQVTNNLLVTMCASHSVFSACWPRTSTLVGNAHSIYAQPPSVVAHERSALPIGLGTTNGNTETQIRQGSADFSLALRSYLEASTLVARIRPAYYGRSSCHTPIEQKPTTHRHLHDRSCPCRPAAATPLSKFACAASLPALTTWRWSAINVVTPLLVGCTVFTWVVPNLGMSCLITKEPLMRSRFSVFLEDIIIYCLILAGIIYLLSN